MKKVITNEQRQILTGRIGKIGLLLANAALNTEESNVEQIRFLKGEAKRAENTIRSLKNWEVPEYMFITIMTLIDGVRNDKDEDGFYTVPWKLVEAIESILDLM